MSIVYVERSSDSPYVETVMHGRTVSDGSPIRPAEVHWHMVIARQNGETRLLVVGPWTRSGVTHYTAGAEILWIKFKLGTFMPHLPTRDFLDQETILPGAASHSFWLNGSVWLYPDYENADTFVERLAREELLVCDPIVQEVLRGRTQELSLRTVRHRFLQATGLNQSHIYQFERARRAEALLKQGASILDTVYEAGYYDQPHLTRALKRMIGHTPAQIVP